MRFVQPGLDPLQRLVVLLQPAGEGTARSGRCSDECRRHRPSRRDRSPRRHRPTGRSPSNRAPPRRVSVYRPAPLLLLPASPHGPRFAPGGLAADAPRRRDRNRRRGRANGREKVREPGQAPPIERGVAEAPPSGGASPRAVFRYNRCCRPAALALESKGDSATTLSTCREALSAGPPLPVRRHRRLHPLRPDPSRRGPRLPPAPALTHRA